MGRFGRGGDEPRVVGFEFGPPVQAPPPPTVPYNPGPPRPMSAPSKPSGGKFQREVTAVVALFGLLVAAGIVVRLQSGGDEPAATAAVDAPVKAPSLPPLLEDLNAPATVGGMPRLATRYSRQLATYWRQNLPNNGRHAEIEVYGRQMPAYIVVAGNLSTGNTAAVFKVATATDTKIRWGALRAYAGGISCATMTFSGVRGSICTWAGKISDGALAGYEQPNPAALAKVTAQVRQDVERGR